MGSLRTDNGDLGPATLARALASIPVEISQVPGDHPLGPVTPGPGPLSAAGAPIDPSVLVPPDEQAASAHPQQDPPPFADAEGMRRLHDELVHTALELARLTDHHRRELADAMAELTRLQRQVRAETRSAIVELRQLSSMDAARASAADGEPTSRPTGAGPADEPTTRRSRRGRRRREGLLGPST